jgi:hypothetical protein
MGLRLRCHQRPHLGVGTSSRKGNTSRVVLKYVALKQRSEIDILRYMHRQGCSEKHIVPMLDALEIEGEGSILVMPIYSSRLDRISDSLGIEMKGDAAGERCGVYAQSGGYASGPETWECGG